ncbi:MAG: hypothetical protein R6V02_09190 [Candidatus Aminicenantes bacterium]
MRKTSQQGSAFQGRISYETAGAGVLVEKMHGNSRWIKMIFKKMENG